MSLKNIQHNYLKGFKSIKVLNPKPASNFKTLKLERTPCFGSCPVYKIEVSGTGKVKYNGEYFVEKKGAHTWQLSSKVVEQLNQLITEIGYFAIKEKRQRGEFITISTCMTSCITSVLLDDGSFRKINNNYGVNIYQRKLSTFEYKVDKLIGVKGYIGNEKLP